MGLKFDSVDLKEQFGFVVTKADGRGSPPISSTKLVVPRVDGAVLLNQRMDVRRISISGYVYGNTAAEAAQKKDGLIKLISTAYNSEKKLQFPDTNRYVYVRLAGEPIVIGPVGPVFGAYAYEISLNFEAIDPYFYGDEFNYNDAGFVFSVDADAPIYLISPRREFLEHEPNVTIYPVTIVNLLGKYGDFETDSNGDGLADGWKKSNTEKTTFSLDTGIINSYSQKLLTSAYTNTSGSIDKHYIKYEYIPVINEHYYAILTYAKTNGQTARINYCDIIGGTQAQYAQGAIYINNTSWQRFVSKIHVLYDNNQLTLNYFTQNVNDGETLENDVELWIDGAMIVDLTAMGTLPPPLQEIYDVENWSDLDGDTLAQLLPFCNGICTLGFTWAGDL